MRPRCVITCRFSDRPGAEECQSNDVQEAECRKYAAAQGYDVDEPVEADDAISGKDKQEDPDPIKALAKRPGIMRAIERCRKGWVLLCLKRDRIARDAYIQTAVDRILAQKGARLESVLDPNGSGLGDKMTRAVLAVLAEEERATISLRTAIFMRRYQDVDHRRMGRVDRPPFGWKPDAAGPKNAEGQPTSLAKDPAEQKTLVALLALAAKGMGGRAIARELDRRGLARRGKTWVGAEGTITAIIRRNGQG